MANVRAFRSGNWSDTNPVTSPWGTSGVLYAPAPGDDVYANSFTVTVNTSPIVVSVRTGAATSLLWKDGATANATAGGGFTLNNGVTLTANVFAGSTTACTLNSGSATITGNCISGSSYNAFSVYNVGSGTLTVNGNVSGGSGDTANGAQNQNTGTLTVNGNVSASGSSNNGSGAVNIAGGIINITGNVLGAAFGGRGALNAGFGRINISGNVTGGSNASNAHGAVNSSTGRIVITNGTVTGGSNATAYGAHNASTGVIEITGVVNGASSGAPGVRNEVGGQILLTGTATGGSNSAGYGVHNFGNGVVTITGLAAGGSAATGARNEAAGIINLTRAVGNGFGFGSVGLSAAAGVTNVSVTGEIGLQEIEYGVLGMTPTSGSRIKLLPQGTNQAKFNFTSTATPKTLVDASATGDMPAASNVRNGTAYAAGTVVGTLVIPAAGSVALGVPVDATTGTAFLTGDAVATAVWGAVARTITGGTITGAADITAIKAKTDLLNTDRLAQCATTSIVGNLIAQSNS